MRRDKLGRVIGRNWWREYIHTEWFYAHHAWLLAREDVALGYSTEELEYAEAFPQPTLKMFMESLAKPKYSDA